MSAVSAIKDNNIIMLSPIGGGWQVKGKTAFVSSSGCSMGYVDIRPTHHHNGVSVGSWLVYSVLWQSTDTLDEKRESGKFKHRNLYVPVGTLRLLIVDCCQNLK